MSHKRGLEDYVISRNVKVPLKQIRIEDNMRSRYPKGYIVVLADSIAQNGLMQAPVLEQNSRNRYALVCGHCRYLATEYARDRGWITYDYLLSKVVRPLPENLRLRVQEKENELKKTVGPHKLARVMWERYRVDLLSTLHEEEEREFVRSARYFDAIPEDIRHRLPVNQYADRMGFDRSTVHKAFQFQRLHADIAREVAHPEVVGKSRAVSYSAACRLASVPNKNVQRGILKNIRDGKNKARPTEAAIGRAVANYLAAEAERERDRQEQARGMGILVSEPNGKTTRPGDLREFSECLRHSTRLVGLYDTVREVVPSISSLEVQTNGHVESVSGIIADTSKALSLFHSKFLTNSRIYRSLWEVTRRPTSARGLVSSASGPSHGKRSYLDPSTGVSKVVDISLIKANRLNPRGPDEKFDKEDLEPLVQSILEEGLIHDMLVMQIKGGKGYRNLEGHRRHVALKIARERGGPRKVGVFVKPPLSEEDQIRIMCDSDIYERVSEGDRARAIARQYELETRSNGKGYEISDFIRAHPEWSPRLIKDCIAYASLPEPVRCLQEQEILSYRAAIELSRITDPQACVDFAVSAAILGQGAHRIREILEERVDTSQQDLLDASNVQQGQRDAELRRLGTNLNDYLKGAQQRTRDVGEQARLRNKFSQDPYLIRVFQKLVRTTNGVLNG